MNISDTNQISNFYKRKPFWLVKFNSIEEVRSEILKIENISADYFYIAAKNSKGSITDYLLIATATFIILDNEKKKTIVFQEKQNIKNNSNFVEQGNYENTIKKINFSNVIQNYEFRKKNAELNYNKWVLEKKKIIPLLKKKNKYIKKPIFLLLFIIDDIKFFIKKIFKINFYYKY